MRKSPSLQRQLWQFAFYWLPLILWMAWIFYWSSRPKLPRPNRRVGIRDHTFEFWAHTFTFAVLTVLSWRIAQYVPTVSGGILGKIPLLSAGLFSALYGASDELHQRLVPGRWPSLEDWSADLLGTVIAMLLLLPWNWLWKRWGVPLKDRIPLPDPFR